jgi:hypothetical protein
MAVSNIARNLRDAELVLRDGSSPSSQTLLLILDEGDLSWTERQQTIEVKERGSIASGHLRPGDEISVALSFSAKWTQLLGKSLESADPLQLYEFLTFAAGSHVESTSQVGEQKTLQLEFTVRDPSGVAHEKVIFHKVYRETLTLSEGDRYNLISFTGRDFEVRPTIERIVS